ncbi:tetraspanin-8 isoform X1 [Phascolarctos cinereus]|uniref:Tetraspanin n=1 Tax=Phascolarctos cinereus TaxID=38626 RepID=A0A6P5KJT1_PHACI|nr:tetraspanin-8 isoform X1 [Phascolarctos cinereus]XP_020845920.1 tetraspanin-8 isoform X1 [Phascolarctos cinereus]XP_020845921.1 tetraspanin-8 isoform X1 [Phascolarctos cinereus]
MSAVSGFIKYSMFIFNFIFWICGCVILGVSIYARVSKHGEELINEETSGVDIFAAVNLLIAVGTIIMVLGFLGCCGAMKESRCMLLLFFISLLLIAILQIVAGILGIVYKSKIEESFKKNFQEQVEILDQDGTEYETFKNDLDAFQKKFKCCGLINGAADWGKNFDKYSASCECTNITNTNDVCVSYMGKQVYKETCGDYIINFLKKNLVVVAGVAFGVAVIEMLGLVFSMVLYCQIGKK